MVGFIYLLCALTSCLCTFLLFRAYRNSDYKLLLWGSLCFAGLTLNNVLLLIDKFVIPFVDLTSWRLMVALLAVMVFLYGLIWDSE